MIDLKRLLRGAGIALVATMVMLGWGSSAQAQRWGVSADIPVQFIFTGSPNLSGTGSISGFQLRFSTPWYFGVGLTSFSVDAEDAVQSVTTSIDYEFTDVYFEIQGERAHFVLGYGTGGVTMQPFTLGGSTSSVPDDSDATQIFVSLGWPVGNDWELHVGLHQIDAEGDLSIDGVATGTKFDLGGVAHTVGAKVMF